MTETIALPGSTKTIIQSMHSKNVKQYTDTVANTFVGKYISNSIKMAKLAYSGKTDILDTIKQIFDSL